MKVTQQWTTNEVNSCSRDYGYYNHRYYNQEFATAKSLCQYIVYLW